MGSMSDDDEKSKKPEVVEEEIKSMRLKSGDASEGEGQGTIRVGEIKKESFTSNGTVSPLKADKGSATRSPVKSPVASRSPDMLKSEDEEIVGGDVTVKMEPGQPLKLSRMSSQKIVPRAAPLFDDYPDKTAEAKDSFQVIPACIYSNKYIGSTEHVMECDCAEEWGKIHLRLCNSTYRFVRQNADFMLQMLQQGPMRRVGRTRIASIVRLRWSVSAIAAAGPTAKINVSSDNSTPKLQSLKPRRKAMAYELTPNSMLATSYSNTLAKLSMKVTFAAAWSSTTKRGSNTSTLCRLAKANSSMPPRKATWVDSAITPAIPIATWTNGLWATNSAWEFLPRDQLKQAKSLCSTTTSTDTEPIHNLATAVNLTAQALSVARPRPNGQPSCPILPSKHSVSMMAMVGTPRSPRSLARRRQAKKMKNMSTIFSPSHWTRMELPRSWRPSCSAKRSGLRSNCSVAFSAVTMNESGIEL